MEKNPYSPPPTSDASDHTWGGQTITVTARFPPSHLWIFIQLLVKVDGVLVADSILLWSVDKYLQFNLQHEGRTVPCRVRTRKTISNILSLAYELSIDDGPFVARRVPISGVILNALAIVFVVIISAMTGLFWLAVYFFS